MFIQLNVLRGVWVDHYTHAIATLTYASNTGIHSRAYTQACLLNKRSLARSPTGIGTKMPRTDAPRSN